MLRTRWFRRAAVWGIGLPILANTFGWIFTEAGRQPWIVYGLMTTVRGVSSVSAADVAFTTAVFVLVYTTLAAVAVMLTVRAARYPLEEAAPPAEGPGLADLVY